MKSSYSFLLSIVIDTTEIIFLKGLRFISVFKLGIRNATKLQQLTRPGAHGAAVRLPESKASTKWHWSFVQPPFLFFLCFSFIFSTPWLFTGEFRECFFAPVEDTSSWRSRMYYCAPQCCSCHSQFFIFRVNGCHDIRDTLISNESSAFSSTLGQLWC